MTTTIPTQLPIGTILPFAGDVYDSNIADQLNKQGFLPCIGLSQSTTGPYAALFQVIQYNFGGSGDVFDLPDLRGLFIIGPAASTRVGSLISCTTARPVTPFVTSEDGDHTHTLDHVPNDDHESRQCAGHSNARWSSGSVSLTTGGDHAHASVSGGDAETRPLNVALDYIIKYADV